MLTKSFINGIIAISQMNILKVKANYGSENKNITEKHLFSNSISQAILVKIVIVIIGIVHYT